MNQYSVELKAGNLNDVSKLVAVANILFVYKEIGVGDEVALRLHVQTSSKVQGLSAAVSMNMESFQSPNTTVIFKPYANQGDTVICNGDAAPADLGDYVTLQGTDTKFFIGKSLASKTDFYTPFENVNHYVI